MSNLVLELKAGDHMVVNGAAIRFRSRARIELTQHARFLYGRQIMRPDQATSPARRIYFALQTAYIGEPAEREAGLAQARLRIVEFQAATTSATARALLDQALGAAEADRCYLALRLVRRVLRHEDAVLGQPLTTAEGAGHALAGGDAEDPDAARAADGAARIATITQAAMQAQAKSESRLAAAD